ncbi:putative mfs multidrug transporter [Phaeomoniella chlamydospora]|uniref:Putative mfs multidrug transporter n=1 Tax=Phaeomoniella chlamydospora TaxID=158046 RepID=A0A0G2ES05_PHACM|nr:putative mfs multidrug transporter [Phaeomoniella chlamydospora]
MWKQWLRMRRHAIKPNHEDNAFPKTQLFVLALCRICEPIAFMSIFPYAYYMIASFHITQDRDQISTYAGLLITAFTFAEFSTGVVWGKISDKIGRKPALIMGLAGTTASMILFGFSTSLPMALIARALGGFLNGNVGVLQTTVAELVTVKEHQPRAYSIMPFVWCLGSIVGPAMGGALARPCQTYPELFPSGTIFERYPFLLPNLVCVVILCCGITVGILFLEETHASLKYRRDYGLELGNWLWDRVCGSGNRQPSELKDDVTLPSFQADDEPPAYQTRENSPRISSTTRPYKTFDPEANEIDQRLGCSTVFSKNILLIIAGYGILAFHSVSFDMLMPVFLSQPKSHSLPHLPFQFVGGFELSTKAIGLMMAVQGVYAMVAQLWLFPFVVRRYGTLNIFRLVMLVWPLLYLVVPYAILLPEPLQIPAIYFALLAKITFHVIAFPSSALLLNNAVPSKLVLGTVNGVAASTASLSRAFGPAVTGTVNAFGLQIGYSGLAWWLNGIVCAIGAAESFWMKEGDGRGDRQVEEEERPTCEPLLHTTSMEPANDEPTPFTLNDDHDDVDELLLSAKS